MLKTISAVGAVMLASALVVPTVSQAATPEFVSVSYAELNLASAKGRQLLERRIAAAAGQVCAFGGIQDLSRATQAKACRSDAIARVQPQFDAAVNAARRGTVTVLGAAALTVTAR